MGLEIERKWIITQDLPATWEVFLEEKVWTAYPEEQRNLELRLRRRGDRECVLTLKWASDESGTVREEFEIPVSRSDYERLTASLPVLMREDRHLRLPGGEILELKYIPEMERCYGEVEFPTLAAAEAFTPPAAWGTEVTGRSEDSFRSVYRAYVRGAFNALYYEEPEITCATLEVLELRGNRVRLDRNIFYPEGGGQPGDRGRLGPRRVTNTVAEDDGVYLCLDDGTGIVPGERYEARPDVRRRRIFRRQHTAEHLLSGLARRHYGVHNCGFHMNEECMTLDFNRRLDKEEIRDLELRANAAIRENAAVQAHYGTARDFADRPYRAKREFTGPLRLIEIEGYDLCACSALHVRSTGELGLVTVLNETGVRGGSRLTVKVGEEALQELLARADILTALAEEKSCRYTELADRYAKDTAERTALKKENRALRRSLLKRKIADLPASPRPPALIAAVDREEAEITDLYELLMKTERFRTFLLLRPIARQRYAFKLHAQDRIADRVAALRSVSEMRGGVKDRLAQGILECEGNLIAGLRAVGYEIVADF